MLRTSIVACAVALCTSGCAYSIYAPAERLSYTLPADESWRIANDIPLQVPDINPGGGITEYVRGNESLENWTELVTLQTQYRMAQLSGMETAKDVYQKLVKTRERECPGSTRWQVIEETPGRISYEWRSKPCLGWPDQHEVSLLADGTRDRFRLAYTAKTTEMDGERHDKWLAVLRAAQLQTQSK